jgi:hypothetical protein
VNHGDRFLLCRLTVYGCRSRAVWVNVQVDVEGELMSRDNTYVCGDGGLGSLGRRGAEPQAASVASSASPRAI